MTTQDWNALPLEVNAITHKVFVKGSWADPWVEEDRLHCDSATWAAGPAVSTASLTWQHGRIREPDDAKPQTVLKLDRRGWFVKIEFTTHDAGTKEWVGFVDTITDDDYAATLQNIITGKQRLSCYGIEQALNWNADIPTYWEGGNDKPVPAAPWFNRGGDPNKATGLEFFKYDKFRPDQTSAGVPEYWSTRSIVRYLVEKCTPKNDADDTAIVFELDGESNLPDWDRPQLDCQGKTVFACLNRLVNDSTLLLWYAREDAGVIKIHIATRTELDVTLPEGTIPAAASQYSLIADNDPLTTISPSSSTIEKSDVIVCRGAKKISVVCPQWIEGDLKPAWDSESETKWWKAGKDDPDYADLNEIERIDRNSAKRADIELADVGTLFSLEMKTDYFPNENDDTPHEPHPGSCSLLNWLPFRQGVDYSEIPDDSEHEQKPYRRPSILRKSGEVARDMSKKSSDSYSVAFQLLTGDWSTDRDDVTRLVSISVSVEDNGRAIRLHSSDMGIRPYTEGADKPHPNETPHSFMPTDDVVFQLAIEEDRYAEGQYPETLPTRDIVKKSVIDAGEQYKQIWVADHVFLRFENGSQVFAESGYIRDDVEKLKSLAKTIYEWRNRDRRECLISTQRFLSTVDVGDLIVEIKSGTAAVAIGSVVDSITIATPGGGPASITITTNLREANWMGLLA